MTTGFESSIPSDTLTEAQRLAKKNETRDLLNELRTIRGNRFFDSASSMNRDTSHDANMARRAVMDARIAEIEELLNSRGFNVSEVAEFTD